MAGHSGSNVQTFSIGFENEKFDESRYAKKVADHLGTNHHELIVNPDPSLLLQKLGRTFDQPFADSSAIPTYLVSEFARNNLVVALTGDGGDEAFSGYTRYKALPQVQKFNQLLTLFGPLKSISLDLAKKYGNRRLERLIEELSPAKNLQERYSIAMSLFEPHLLKGIWANSEGLSASDEPAKWFSRLWKHSEKLSLNTIETMSTMDMRSYLPGDLLVKVDIASMANSIETRSPLLDHNVIEFAASIPYEYRMKNGESKHVLRQIARDLVPAQLIDRPKMGFAIPRAEWLRGPLREMSLDLLTDSTFRSRGWFNPVFVQGLLQKHSGGRDLDEQIWPLLMIELWAREWID
jgi:asparagine synthase (glutamine-hydrolysing)